MPLFRLGSVGGEEGRHFAPGVGRDAKDFPQAERGREGPQPRKLRWGCDGTARPQRRHPSSGSQAESKQAGQSVFRRGLLNRLQQEYQAREQLRARSPRGWVCYVTFICNIFDYLRVRPPQPRPCSSQPVS